MSAPTQTQSTDNTLLYLFLAAVIYCLFYFVWDSYHFEIAYYSLKASWYLLGVFDWPISPEFIARWRAEIATAALNSGQLDASQILHYANRAGYFYVIIPAGLTLLCLKQTLNHPSLRTKRAIDADSLRNVMAEHATALIPVLYYGDLLNAEPESQRSAKTPEEWASGHGLIRNGRLHAGEMESVLITELGPRLEGLEDMALHEQYLFTVFCIRLYAPEAAFEQSLELLDALNRSCHIGTWKGERGYPAFAEIPNRFQEFSARPEVKELFRYHPYARTLLYKLHEEALRHGKLPSSYFRWLKGMDRTLWYVLNTTGRKAPFAESLAVFTQARWESFARSQGYCLQEPCVTDAVKSMESYLHQAGIITLEQQ